MMMMMVMMMMMMMMNCFTISNLRFDPAQNLNDFVLMKLCNSVNTTPRHQNPHKRFKIHTKDAWLRVPML